MDFAVFVSSAMAITLVFAVASWHGIEKRCLKLGRKKKPTDATAS
jgi:peptidoglycan/LPS O-acetylase OafA/YrhL